MGLSKEDPVVVALDDMETFDIDKTSKEAGSASVDERKLLRRIDFKVLPMLFIVYMAAFLDRVNISNALTMNLPQELGLVGYQQNVALTIFFVPYIIFELPSNLALKRFKPHAWLSGCILIFGIAMFAQGFVQNYSGLLATRFVLGLAEAGIFPGSFYLISFWYKREEAQKRFTFHWCSVLVSAAFGGLLASAIANMNGSGGFSNWRWVFILEGTITIIIGIVAYFRISDFPDEATWLTEDERKWVIARTGRAAPTKAEEKITGKNVLSFFKDVKNLLAAIIDFSTLVPIYAFSYFAPTIIKGLGYNTVQTQLHTVPPIAAALGLTAALAYLSDRTGVRSPYIILCNILTIVGFALLAGVHNNFSVQYFGICLIAMGAFGGGPLVICWYVMNLRGHVGRAIGTAWLIGFGNTGAIVATFSFLATEAPYYSQGYRACLGVSCLGLVCTILYAVLLKAENRTLWRNGTDKDLINVL